MLASDLTLIECERVLIRAVTLGEISEADAADRRAVLRRAWEHWTRLHLDEEIADRARRPFPGEPVRTLDALHLATLLVGRGLVSGLVFLALDQRLRASARDLGVEVLPES